MIPIYIPTRGRTNKQTTWESIGSKVRSAAVLVCPDNEVSTHESLGRKTLNRGSITGINNARQFILEHALEKGHDKIIILDDDLIFGRRISDVAPNLRKTKPEEMHELFDIMSEYLNSYVHVGVSPRQMNDKHFPARWKECMRQNAVHGIQPKVLKEEHLRYDTVDLMEDYYMTLSLFKLGYPNVMITDWTWDQRGASGAVGGCSSYRNAELQERASKKLEAMFPKHVKAVKKETKTGWDNMKVRWDVRVQWRKAASDGDCI
tara:strand:- start:578 stop:1363 length:786 start_codon:yes stop_codon:yes gene_type:complete